ncbi:hypothetical protein I5R69_25915 [Serratia marcescens]|nr:hypothetical protein [Serratia marcescens]
MDNKLSELSKPIGVSFKSDIDLMKSGRMIHGQMTVWKSTVGIPESQEGVYSQEYVSALLARIAELESTEIKPEGMRLMSEAIGAHGYIVGCLVQGRHDLALEESRKWVDAFSQAAELINNG